MRIEEYKGVIDRYFKYLPVSRKTPVISLLEGNTPLIYSKKISSLIGRQIEVYLKYEGTNPTGSFKDRGMTVAISKAKEERQVAVICASTGNTSASASAYAARARLKCIVIVPEKKIASGKLAQAFIYGARVILLKGNFDQALNIARKISAEYPVRLVNSLNPHRIEGQKTASFEICDVLGEAPDFQIMPVGNAGNITAYWKGYKEYYSCRKIRKLPVLCGFQAEGAAPIVKGYPVRNPRTIATAIRIGNPASWKTAVEARQESGGLIDTVTDREILEAYKFLSREEGLFVEPASATSLAGLFKLKRGGYFKKKLKTLRKRPVKIVCILTGHGLKDPEVAIKSVKTPGSIEPDIKKIVKAIGLS